jgi:hypothetical protein
MTMNTTRYAIPADGAGDCVIAREWQLLAPSAIALVG